MFGFAYFYLLKFSITLEKLLSKIYFSFSPREIISLCI